MKRLYPISIWEPREIDGETVFVRPDPSPAGDHHAAVKTLRPKKSPLPLRVALFGESVAAGYLYAPHLTPAQVLESQLRAIGGEENFEVIDLARTNETLGSMAETVRTALQINPDVLVLFAGNNWNLLETPEISPYALSVAARQRYAAALREEGIAGPIRLAEETLRERVNATFETISQIAWTVGIPVIVLIPEVNLADWENRQPPTWLPGDGTARWHHLYREALQALEAQDFRTARRTAEAMKDLDAGRCPTTWRLLAKAWTGLGDLDQARQACLEEVDAARYPTNAFLGSPQATTQSRALLKENAHRHGFLPIDLREIFAHHTGSNLPGRRLFLDYCHLTREGIQIAMAATAAEALNLSGLLEEKQDWRDLLRRLPPPQITPEAEATAYFGAAIHTAHRLLAVGSKRPILEHWLKAALEASQGIAEKMRDLIEARLAPCPAVLTAAQQRNLASPYRLLLQHGWRWDYLDAELIEAIQAVLGEEIDFPPLEEEPDLTQPPYLWEPVERFFPEAMSLEDIPRRAAFRAAWPESSFCLVWAGGKRDLELEITLRVPEAGVMRVGVNGEEVGGIGATERWSRVVVRIEGGRLRRGLNQVTLRWPLPGRDREVAMRAMADRLEVGGSGDVLHLVFGEVFSLISIHSRGNAPRKPPSTSDTGAA